jgi:hypothetical protein
MNPDVKTFTSFWIPVRLLKELENKKGKLSRNQLAVSLIEKGLTYDGMMKSVVEKGAGGLKPKNE